MTRTTKPSTATPPKPTKTAEQIAEELLRQAEELIELARILKGVPKQ